LLGRCGNVTVNSKYLFMVILILMLVIENPRRFKMKRNISKRLLIVLSLILVVFFTLGCAGGNAPIDDEGNTPTDGDRAIIGISWCEDTDVSEYSEDLQAYIDAVELAGGVSILLPLIAEEGEAVQALDGIDALIMTGGEDIDPSYYNEEVEPTLEEVNAARDQSDFILLTAALERDMPILAICRGYQFLNVVCGGTLYQDIPTQFETETLHRSLDQVDFVYHNIDIAEGSQLAEIMGSDPINVNSWHHQAIKDLGDGLSVVAMAQGGIVEAIEKDGSTFVLGVQFHPEWHVVDGDMAHLVHLALFEKLVEYGLK
jgi:putative glutamine amidotransferase